ncbi:MAG: hypothetical protein IJ773_03795 [Lachnospiraceae bacterium]|nr:hypothetical protein [Lachnospiraceae bacterium]
MTKETYDRYAYNLYREAFSELRDTAMSRELVFQVFADAERMGITDLEMPDYLERNVKFRIREMLRLRNELDGIWLRLEDQKAMDEADRKSRWEAHAALIDSNAGKLPDKQEEKKEQAENSAWDEAVTRLNNFEAGKAAEEPAQAAPEAAETAADAQSDFPSAAEESQAVPQEEQESADAPASAEAPQTAEMETTAQEDSEAGAQPEGAAADDSNAASEETAADDSNAASEETEKAEETAAETEMTEEEKSAMADERMDNEEVTAAADEAAEIEADWTEESASAKAAPVKEAIYEETEAPEDEKEISVMSGLEFDKERAAQLKALREGKEPAVVRRAQKKSAAGAETAKKAETPEPKEEKEQEQKLAEKGSTASNVLFSILLFVVILVLVWIVLNILMYAKVIPMMDFGYQWFNDNVFPMFWV